VEVVGRVEAKNAKSAILWYLDASSDNDKMIKRSLVAE